MTSCCSFPQTWYWQTQPQPHIRYASSFILIDVIQTIQETHTDNDDICSWMKLITCAYTPSPYPCHSHPTHSHAALSIYNMKFCERLLQINFILIQYGTHKLWRNCRVCICCRRGKINFFSSLPPFPANFFFHILHSIHLTILIY